MVKFIRKLLYFLPILLAMAIFNTQVDPAHILGKGYEAGAARLILAGKNVAGMKNYDERLFQKEVILNRIGTPDTVFIGSSRVMDLSDEVVPNLGDYWNAGLSGAGVYDYYGILGLYYEKGSFPKKIIIGPDPWILNDNNGDNRYLSLQQEIEIFTNAIGSGSKARTLMSPLKNLAPWISKEKQAISPSYLHASIDAVNAEGKAAFGNDVDYFGTEERFSDNLHTRLTDGTLEYSTEYRSRTAEEAETSAKTYISGSVYQMEHFDKLSSVSMSMLESMIEYLLDQKVEIILFLPPFHPYVYQYLTSHDAYKNIVAAEAYFRELADKRGITVYGSYDPALLACDESCFIDGMHMRRPKIAAAWKMLPD